MYNCLFGMPNRHNFPFNSAFYKNPRPYPSKNFNSIQQIPEKHENNKNNSASNSHLLRSSALGGIVIPSGTSQGTTYNIISINLDTSAYRNFTIQFNFSCNIATVLANMHLRFQLFKHEKYPAALIPVSSSFIYTRIDSTETNTFSLLACDCDSINYKCCNYSVFVEIMGLNTVGTILITNPILIASVIENDNEIAEKGEVHDISDQSKI